MDTPYAVILQNINKEFAAQGGEQLVKAVENVNLEIANGEFFSMLGPSGCGKTTTLRMIAGFEEPTSGKILLDGVDISHIPPFHRPVNTVFQDYALFPHMTVNQNIAFGLEMEKQKRSRTEIQQRVKEMLELVQLPHVGNRMPKQLSGGQQQRVALARALVKRPKVLLLDEPLGALDLKLRKQMQLELKHMQKQLGITFIYVTHDQEEALTMSDRIAVMNLGRVLQVGRPVDIYNAPDCHFVADFIGETNFLNGVVVDQNPPQSRASVRIGDMYTLEATMAKPVTNGQAVTVAIRPEKVELTPIAEHEQDGLVGRLEEEIFIGTDTRFLVRLPDGSALTSRIQNDHISDAMGFDVGHKIAVTCPPQYTLVLTE